MDFASEVAQMLDDRSQQGLFSGVVLIGQGSASLFQGAYGFAHRPWGIPNRLDTRFRVASISKMFTAVAVLQLVQEGRLGLDTPLVPALGLEDTRIPEEVTVHHLLTMTSGIADWFDESGDWEANWAALLRDQPVFLLRTNRDYLPLFAHLPPVAEVGAGYRYNGAGYILLGLLVEHLGGMSYDAFVRERVFARAGMAHSDFVALDGLAVQVAEGYMPEKDARGRIIGWRKNIYSTTPAPAADGGATSTTVDLQRFSQSLRRGELLSPVMTEAMLTPRVLQQEERVREYIGMYGYGNMFLLDGSEQVVRYGHTGEEDGVSCRLYHYPGPGLDVIILGNQSWCAGEIGWLIHDRIVEAFGLAA